MAALLAGLLLAGAARAQDDLDLIPALAAEPRAADYVAGQRFYLEDALTLSSNRDVLGVQNSYGWQERLLFDMRKEWRLGEDLSFTYSGRFNLRAENDIAAPTHENLVNDLREAYLAWRPAEDVYLDAGRINLKSGVALGFNPTDFFKTRSVVEPLSADPSVQREDRLGTLMALGQFISGRGALTLAMAPALMHATPIYGNDNLHSFDPSFDRTNAANRFLAKGSFRLSDDLSPELLFYREGARTAYGANLADNFGSSIVGYAEWSGSRRADLIGEALVYGRSTGALPEHAPDLWDKRGAGFSNQLAVGASYTSETKIAYNLEYHFDQASFTGSDWRRWFAAPPSAAGELWYLRGYAQDRQEPIGRHSLFLRADWVDAFIPRLELVGFANTDLNDGSTLVEATASYYLSDQWTIGAQISASLGEARTDFASLPQRLASLFQVTRYF